MPRGDAVAIKSQAPISRLKEISDSKLSRHETCQEADRVREGADESAFV